MSIITLFSAEDSNTSSAEFSASDVNPNQNQYPFLGLSGEFDGALIYLEWKDPDGNWGNTDSNNDYWTQGGLQPLELNSFSQYRLTISNVGASTSISAWAFGASS